MNQADEVPSRTSRPADMVAVTMGTSADELAYLCDSCMRFGLEERYVELGVGQQWTGFGMRWRLIREWMESAEIEEDTWIIFNDGYDTACQQSLSMIQEVLSEFDPDRLVVSAELYPWPEEVIPLAIEHFGPIDGRYKFPCAGQYAGTRRALDHLYRTTEIKDDADDQATLLRYLIAHPQRVTFDTDHRLFQANLYRLRNDVIEEPAKKWTKTLNKDLEIRTDPSDSQKKFFHKGRDTAACFVHANGCKYTIERLRKRAEKPAWWPF